MTGILVDDIVEVRDQSEGSRLYTRGNYGYPRSGGGVDLDLIEATYLSECNRLDVELDGSPVRFDELFRHSSTVLEDFDIRYLVYRDFRQRGFVVKTETGDYDLSVFPRGKTLSNSRPEYYVKAVSERATFETSDLISQAIDAEERKRSILYAVVDEEGDVTYYRMALRDPFGKVFPVKMKEIPVGWLVRDRVFVYEMEDAEALRTFGFYGKTVGNFMQLSLVESCHLVSKGRMQVLNAAGEPMSFDDLREVSSKVQDGFDIRLAVFSDLRERGLVVKSGFKYGNHFRAYTSSPDDCHARYLVHAITDGGIRTWSEVSKTVRLSGGVKKEILLGRVSRRDIKYLEFQWFRP
ncbi:MAG: tRNA-intron lyase [Candidatus Methanomethylophilaceae archaeon]|nr:tRNA-intron lyase [Candidatus Methanomethylophilaceae archaeon]MBR4181714.1 tRNA-intron lyase [Candidatus Methanomethylophilaceae archaeon]